jgi:hypothetical protein
VPVIPTDTRPSTAIGKINHKKIGAHDMAWNAFPLTFYSAPLTVMPEKLCLNYADEDSEKLESFICAATMWAF